ncbi:MAG: Fe-S cluster assembly protein SufB, partial [Planctomycetaceae bacterium]|nr:Fe-S cluster assembly protein SufB [Planctomycetaceae bacterium]
MATDLNPTNELSESEELKQTEINKYNFRTESKAVFKARKGVDAEIVNQISDIKDEPDWMRKFRLDALEVFESKPMPTWGGDISIDFDDIYYYLKPTSEQGKTWDDVPQEIKDTF